MSGFALPALRSLGKLADSSPVIIVDTREQQPLVFSHLESRRGTLGTGDYSILGLEQEFSVERKGSIDEVALCCGEERERFTRELFRLRSHKFRRLLIVGSEEAIVTHQYRSNIKPQSVLGSLYAWQARFDIPIAWCQTPAAAARLTELWVFYYCREVVESANNLLRGCQLQGASQFGPSRLLSGP
jgi:ERCC4-type nuclease